MNTIKHGRYLSAIRFPRIRLYCWGGAIHLPWCPGVWIQQYVLSWPGNFAGIVVSYGLN